MRNSNSLIHATSQQKDADYIWHPFTQHGLEKTTLPVKRAKDASLFLENGQEIIDCISSWWTITHGHNHPKINQALKDQIDQLSHVMFAGFTHAPAISLSEKLLQATQHKFAKVFFADNGSGAVEVALKLAYQYHYNKGHSDKTLFLAFEGGYHGDTFGAMATGRTTGFYTPFEPFLCDVTFIPYPDTYIECNDIAEKEHKALKALENIIHTHQDKICCMILEPLMQGASGMRFARPDFIQKLCDMLRKANILVIFDEVATAFGRTGEMFAFHHLDFIPDFICLSKGLTAGYLPLSVTLTQQHIYDAFLGTDYKSSFTHGHSFTANPLACSAASASLDVFAEEDVLARIRNISEYYYALVPELQKLDMITNIRILGSVLAWDLKIEDRFYKSKSSEKLKDYFLEHGFNIRPLGKSFYLLPPYCITQQQLDKISDAIFNGFA